MGSYVMTCRTPCSFRVQLFIFLLLFFVAEEYLAGFIAQWRPKLSFEQGKFVNIKKKCMSHWQPFPPNADILVILSCWTVKLHHICLFIYLLLPLGAGSQPMPTCSTCECRDVTPRGLFILLWLATHG